MYKAELMMPQAVQDSIVLRVAKVAWTHVSGPTGTGPTCLVVLVVPFGLTR